MRIPFRVALLVAGPITALTCAPGQAQGTEAVLASVAAEAAWLLGLGLVSVLALALLLAACVRPRGRLPDVAAAAGALSVAAWLAEVRRNASWLADRLDDQAEAVPGFEEGLARAIVAVVLVAAATLFVRLVWVPQQRRRLDASAPPGEEPGEDPAP